MARALRFLSVMYGHVDIDSKLLADIYVASNVSKLEFTTGGKLSFA